MWYKLELLGLIVSPWEDKAIILGKSMVIEEGEPIIAIDDTIKYGEGWQGRIKIVMGWLFTHKVEEQGHY